MYDLQQRQYRPASDYDVRHGFLSPDGKMYDVGFQGHDEFARSRGTDQDTLYKQKWLKLSEDSWYADDWSEGKTHVSQRQFDYIFDWHAANNREFFPGDFIVV